MPRVNNLAISKYPVVIVGAGLFGLTMAEKITSELDIPVLIIEKRNHIGGNAYSEIDPETGIEVHKYGSHIFHTSNQGIWEYVNQFTAFNNYKHKVKTQYQGQIFTMPINLQTINQFLDKDLTPSQAETWVKEMASEIKGPPQNLEEKAISLVGRPLYEAFVRGYTMKQWETDPRELPAAIISRLPVRYDTNDYYFDDTHQGLPSEGYAAWFENMIKHPKIDISLNTDFFDFKDQIQDHQFVVYSGPIDRYFNYSKGVLGWRTLDIRIEKLDVQDFQGIPVLNFAENNFPQTRTHEFKHFYPERAQSKNKTIVATEISRFASEIDDPYYPINTNSDREKLIVYRELLKDEKNVIFGGRLGSYQYLDMHMAIGQAITLFVKIKEKLN